MARRVKRGNEAGERPAQEGAALDPEGLPDHLDVVRFLRHAVPRQVFEPI